MINGQYWIDTSFLKNDPIFGKDDHLINKNGTLHFSSKGYRAKCYLWQLFRILSNDKLPLLRSEKTFNATLFIKDYVEGFKQGQEYFEKSIAVSNDTLYRHSDAYIKDLHNWYYHKEPIEGKFGWDYYLNNYPIIIDKKIIERWGFYSGVLYSVELLKRKHLELFKDFDFQCGFTDNVLKVEGGKKVEKPTVFAYALMHIFLSKYDKTREISKTNASKWGTKYGVSPNTLRQAFMDSFEKSSRKPRSESSRAVRPFIRNFESAVRLIETENSPQALVDAANELQLLKIKYESFL